jgi:hypothetical protein
MRCLLPLFLLWGWSALTTLVGSAYGFGILLHGPRHLSHPFQIWVMEQGLQHQNSET